VRKLDEADVLWSEQKSSQGRFHIFRRAISLALGAKKDLGFLGGGHPFEAELVRLPPTATNWPYHSHSSQFELFIILSGRGEARIKDEIVPVSAGDCIVCLPNEPHQFRNTGQDDMFYYVIADNPIADAVYYPDSDKWAIKPARKIFRISECDYFDGEE
jgi:uncharacterized cupin superfamily protein